ncbi:MAG TPA: MFS transporter [Tepidisphaeraceae bacterium]|nr:MFS transporter [Tepidisphaeraceae bacterium]
MDPSSSAQKPIPSDSQLMPDPERPASAAPTEEQLETQTPGGSKVEGHDPYAALRISGFRLYVIGWVASVIGQQVQSVAVQWQIAQRVGMQHEAMALGLVGGIQALPIILLALPAGHLADRFDRRRVIQIGQVVVALCSLGLAAASHWNGSIYWFYLLLGLSATGEAIGWPARSALLPQIVPAEEFANAATWNSSAFQVASVAGPAVGGLIIYFSQTAAYMLDAVCAVTFFSLLLLLSVEAQVRTKEPISISNLVAGVRFVWRTKVILGAITLDLFAVLLGGATYLLPIFAADILHVGSFGFGWLRAAPAIGAFIMAMLLAHAPPMKRAGATMLWSVAGFGLATVVFAYSRSFTLSLIAFGLTGAFDNISVVVRHTLVQMLPPDRMRGRVSAVNNVFIGASNEIGGLESGLAAWGFARLLGPMSGAIASVAFGGFGAIVVVIVVAMFFPDIRRFGSLRDARPIEDDASPAAA